METQDFIVQTKAKIAQLTDPALEIAAVDLNNCDREPIHIPAAIQPHGVLLVLSEPDWTIVQVSQNTADYLGHIPEALLGQSLLEILSETQVRKIEQCLTVDFEAVNPLWLDIKVKDTVQTFSAIVHRSGTAVLLELEPMEAQAIAEDSSFLAFHNRVKQPVSRLRQTQSLAELCQVAVEVIKQITGFDRVMVYHFDPDGSGSVIAEAVELNLTPYLGLHYPATDVPKQAKYLYLLNPVRLIPDVAYQPVPLISGELPLRDEPLDMSLSTLRSVSPLHTEYLSNMGVRASMSISLVHNHQLWGLIACHHNDRRQVSYELRTVCEFLGQVIGLELAAKERHQDASYKISLTTSQTRLIQSLPKSQTLQAGLTSHPDDLMALTGSTGVAFCEKGKITLLGETPTPSEVEALVEWLSEPFAQDVVYHTSALSQVYAPATEFQGRTSGLLALSISQVQRLSLLWFRPEVLKTVNWAGNPEKPIEITDGGEVRMSPRQSFELWKEMVQLQSHPWKTCEIEAALELRSTIIGLVLQKADELAQLNTELERSNAELDAFAYIASHDLKEPLRGIHNYSSFLIEDYGNQLGEDGTEKLQTLMRLTERMEDLINSLLQYSRLGRAEMSVCPVDLNELVNGVIDLIKMSKPEQVQFRIPRSLPTLACDRTQVTELLTNLISNGIKYNSKAEKTIEIGYQTPTEATDQQCWPASGALATTVFYVRDNGIGIHAKHFDSIFRIFKRLHTPGKFGGGTGAGLTIAKKIVERHGGQIWVDSIYGEGSTFYFTLEGQDHG